MPLLGLGPESGGQKVTRRSSVCTEEAILSPFGTASGGDNVLPPDEVPASDPIHSIINTIVELVPVSHWSFARLKGEGHPNQFLSSSDDPDEFRRLEKQEILQRESGRAGPSITATFGPSGPYSSGLALVFADNRARFGLLSMMRTDELGSFTSSEIRALTFALDAASDRLSELRLMESQDERLVGFRLDDSSGPEGRAAAEDATAQYILNRDLGIVFAWTSENERRVAVTALQVPLQSRLPPVLEEAVRSLTAVWSDDAASQVTGVASPVPFLVVRTRPLTGPAGLFIGVTIERSKPARSLTGAAARFHISPREVQVLALLFDGLRQNDVAKRLHVTPSTVQDHIRHLLEKTNSRNRQEMTAKILGWTATDEQARP
jgi:DNA-binding CsgD family transcriptional regulator